MSSLPDRRRVMANVTVVLAVLVSTACSASSPSTGRASVSASTTLQPDGRTVSDDEDDGRRQQALALALPGVAVDYGRPPSWPTGDLAPEVSAAVTVLAGEDFDGSIRAEELEALEVLAASGDPRLAWVISDVLRLTADVGQVIRLTGVAEELVGRQFGLSSSWTDLNNHLIAWDVPAPPGYVEAKRNILTALVPQWRPFFEPNTDIDWRFVAWGGVGVDDRPFASDQGCSCIAAVDNPTVTTADGADWLDDDAVVFGLVVNGEARAYPRRIMEVRELVNDTLGGRDLGLPYCTLCGSAQAFFTDGLPPNVERPVLRTSGLLNRSNKMMFDLTTFSLIDAFTGKARSGPLGELGLQLESHSVITTTWARWRASYPETTVLTEDLALGRNHDFRATRDADGPIFPVGAPDQRLEVHADVLGVVLDSGQAVAFHVDAARGALAAGTPVSVELGNGDVVEVVSESGGLRAVDGVGHHLAGHQAFWFAWSQFYPDTVIWPAFDN